MEQFSSGGLFRVGRRLMGPTKRSGRMSTVEHYPLREMERRSNLRDKGSKEQEKEPNGRFCRRSL